MGPSLNESIMKGGRGFQYVRSASCHGLNTNGPRSKSAFSAALSRHWPHKFQGTPAKRTAEEEDIFRQPAANVHTT